MKKFLTLSIFLFFVSVCNASTPENTANVTNTESSAKAKKVKKTKYRDFPGQVTLEIMDGKLKGTHVFKFTPNAQKQLLTIGLKRASKKDESVARRGSFNVSKLENENNNFVLDSFNKQFKGLINEGNHPAYVSKKNKLSTLRIKNKDENSKWLKAQGKLQTHNDLTFTSIKDVTPKDSKRKFRRIEGSFSDEVKFEYYDLKELLDTETVTVKTTFSVVKRYKPKS